VPRKACARSESAGPLDWQSGPQSEVVKTVQLALHERGVVDMLMLA
jgi:hypothetical protein